MPKHIGCLINPSLTQGKVLWLNIFIGAMAMTLLGLSFFSSMYKGDFAGSLLGAMTFFTGALSRIILSKIAIIMTTLRIMGLQSAHSTLSTECRYAECRTTFYSCAECHYADSPIFIVMMSAVSMNKVMLSAIMLSVITLSVIRLSVIRLSVIRLSVIRLSVIRMSVILPSVIRLSAIRLSVIRLSVIRLSVIRLSVIRLSIIRLSVIRLSVIRLSVIRLSVILPSVIRLSVFRQSVIRLSVIRLRVPSFLLCRVSLDLVLFLMLC